MTSPKQQAAIADDGAPCGLSMEWDIRTDAQALWTQMATLESAGIVVGYGAPLLRAAGADVPGYIDFQKLHAGRYSMPATPHALWIFMTGPNPGAVFEKAERVKRHLESVAVLRESTPLFSYRQGRDLSGYQDGSANPKSEAAWQAALIPDGKFVNGSFAWVQRWLHFRDRFHSLAQPDRDRTLGRSIDTDKELVEAPATAHIKRTDQESFEPPAYILRRSMPWGDVRRHGLQFIAFMDHPIKVQRMLERMVGVHDGLPDALLGHSQAETGAFYFIPPIFNGHWVLPETNFSEGGEDPAARPLAPPPGVEVVESATVRLTVEASRCIHSRNCVLARADVFVPNVVGPWLHPELAGAEELANIARNCPSGAIQVERLDGAPQESLPMRNVIRLRENGPLTIHGDFRVAGLPEIRATLCRCGQSGNKPYCDGSHVKAGFTASGEAPALQEVPPQVMPRTIAIQPMADGPLVVHGAVELVTGTGHGISSASGPTLCRCGHSANKPFCDGSHARVGFKAAE